MGHPARFSKEIIECFRTLLGSTERIHDPCAGTGERLGALADMIGIPFTGTEIESCYIVDRRVREGDSRKLTSYPSPLYAKTPFTIVTSPVYANGMTDNHLPKDGSVRKTYRVAKIALSGDATATLEPGNAAAYGYRQGRIAARKYWAINDAVVEKWIPAGATRALVNVKDFWMAGELVEHGQEWADCLIKHGWELKAMHDIETPGMRYGENREARSPHEWVIEAVPA